MLTMQPNHIAIIMDGNGRWAKKRLMPRAFGHKEGVSVVKKIVTHATKAGIKYLSMFAFSTENWLRPTDEVSILMSLLDDYVVSERPTVMNNNIRFIVSGDLKNIPEKTRNTIKKLEDDSNSNSGMVLNLMLSYGAKQELTHAFKNIASELLENKITLSDITEEMVAKNLYHPEVPDIDLLIRTSGEHRVSNFMLWRLAYAELYFIETLWPDFKEADLDKAIENYKKRSRRFGLVK